MRVHILYRSAAVCLLCLQQTSVFSQSAGTNYRLTETMLDSLGSHKITTIDYYDGLGRPVLTTTDGLTTTGYFTCLMTEYDSLNRKHREWMPAEGGHAPYFLTPSQFRQHSSSTYSGDAYAYRETEYDAIGRPVAASPGGAAWHSARKAGHIKYITNKTGEVRRYTTTGISSAYFTDSGFYPAGTLTGEESEDEDGHSVQVFRDMLGNTVLERRDSGNDTYFVYYNGLPRFVLMPGYQSEQDASQYYRYDYDTMGRRIKRWLPGCAYERFWYDKRGRVSFYQDGRLRARNLYRFYLYDGLSRLVVQGVCTDGSKSDQASGEASFNASLPGIGGSGYTTGDGHSLANPQIETAFYYDNYSCLSSTAFISKCQSLGITSGIGNVTGLMTAKAVATTDGNMLLRVYHYDSKGQVTASYETYPPDMCIETQTEYMFTGQPQSKTVELRGVGFSHSSLLHYYHYYNSGLPKSEEIGVPNATGRIVWQDNYNSIGQVTGKWQDNGRYRTAYTYDVHGWLKSLSSKDNTDNSTVFSQSLFRAEGSGTKLYNGDIYSMNFSMKGMAGNWGYTFTYDGMDRMTKAYNMIIMGNHAQLRCESAAYNANSAIISLTRTGLNNSGYTDNIDQLTYDYDGNRLKKVTDAAYPLLYTGAFDFHDGAILNSEYAYDACGALTEDRNKGVAWVDYSDGGMPVRVQFHDGSVTEHVYTADGVKLKTVHRTAVQNHPTVDYGHTHTLHPDSTAYVDSTRYVGPYEIDRLWNAKYFFGGGYISLANTGTSAYRYFLTDYQDNVRVVADTQGNILQRVNYYPYGAPWNDDISTAGYQTHKYGGKELDLMHGLNLYDFGAREYDPALGLFTSMDPLCEKYYHISPYAYCAGNPVRYKDLFGDSIFVQSHQGTFYHYDMDNRTFLDANGMGYGKDEPFIDNVSNALNALSLKPTGFDLVHNLAVDKKGVLISPTSPIRIRKVSEKKGNVNGEQAYIEFGLTSGIIWDPNSSNMGGAPFISLAHELAHSWDRIQHGFVSERRWGKTGIIGDIYATHIENKIRAENGYPLRAFYGIYEGRLVDPIIDSSGRSLYYDSLENRSKRILKEGGYIYVR